MQVVLVKLARVTINLLYKVCCLYPRTKMILFLSRRANEPSYDFRYLGESFVNKGYKVVYQVARQEASISYLKHVFSEIYYLARCEACFLDRYDPVVSLLNFKCKETVQNDKTKCSAYPCEPVIIQLWHAFGAYKRFGYQSADTPEGHESQVLKTFRIHRNYTWIICTSKESIKTYAEAFNYPQERILPLCRPEFDHLLKIRDDSIQEFEQHILIAPTLRKQKTKEHPYRELYRTKKSEIEMIGKTEWSFHPLETNGSSTGSQYESLQRADIIVTDYSSIVFEAYLLGKKVLFYVPDIEEYRKSPGLNRDPKRTSPEITAETYEELFALLKKVTDKPEEYPQQALDCFIGETFQRVERHCTDRAEKYIELIKEARCP